MRHHFPERREQCTVGAIFIRPIESFDRWRAGLARTRPATGPLAMHAGPARRVLKDGREFVAEQLVGTLFEDFKDALNWTPLERFRTREAAGWDLQRFPQPRSGPSTTRSWSQKSSHTSTRRIPGRPFVG